VLLYCRTFLHKGEYYGICNFNRSNCCCRRVCKWSSNHMMNEIVLEINELEEAVDKLKLVDAPEAFVAIRTIDVMIERKRSQLEAFERTANEN
jgi:hypothetical protein